MMEDTRVISEVKIENIGRQSMRSSGLVVKLMSQLILITSSLMVYSIGAGQRRF